MLSVWLIGRNALGVGEITHGAEMLSVTECVKSKTEIVTTLEQNHDSFNHIK